METFKLCGQESVNNAIPSYALSIDMLCTENSFNMKSIFLKDSQRFDIIGVVPSGNLEESLFTKSKTARARNSFRGVSLALRLWMPDDKRDVRCFVQRVKSVKCHCPYKKFAMICEHAEMQAELGIFTAHSDVGSATFSGMPAMTHFQKTVYIGIIHPLYIFFRNVRYCWSAK